MDAYAEILRALGRIEDELVEKTISGGECMFEFATERKR
jgi:hypothetical protein